MEQLSEKTLRRWANFHRRRKLDKSLTLRLKTFHRHAHRAVLERLRSVRQMKSPLAREPFDWREFCSAYSPKKFSSGDRSGTTVEGYFEDAAASKTGCVPAMT